MPWRMSTTRKANQRDRLKRVDDVIETVRASGITCHALVCLHAFRARVCC